MRSRGRKLALVLAALYAAWRGVRYLPIGESLDQLPAGLMMLGGGLLPIGAWAAAWLAAALWCIASVFRRQDATAWGFLTALMLVWGVAYVVGGVQNITVGTDPGSAWTTATGYLCTGGIIALLAVTPPPDDGRGDADA